MFSYASCYWYMFYPTPSVCITQSTYSVVPREAHPLQCATGFVAMNVGGTSNRTNSRYWHRIPENENRPTSK